MTPHHTENEHSYAIFSERLPKVHFLEPLVIFIIIAIVIIIIIVIIVMIILC